MFCVSQRSSISRILTSCVLIFALPPAVSGQDEPRTVETLAESRKSPQAALNTFFNAFEKGGDLKNALAVMDLSELTGHDVEDQGAKIAVKLRAIIERMSDNRWKQLDPPPQDAIRYSLAEGVADLPAESRTDAMEIVLERDEDGLWRFSAKTIAAVDLLWSRWKEPEKVPGKANGQTPAIAANGADADSAAPPSSTQPPGTQSQKESPSPNGPPTQPPPVADTDPKLVAKLGTPRQTMRTFVRAFNQDGDPKDALLAIDLSDLPKPAMAVKGPVIAYQLKGVIDRMLIPDYEEIPEQPQNDQFSFWDITPHLGNGQRIDAARIVLARGDDGLWRFSKQTVASVDELWKTWGDRPKFSGLEDRVPISLWLAEQFPATLHEQHFLLKDYQWILLVMVIFVGLVADVLTRVVMRSLTRILLRRFTREVNGYGEELNIWRPLGLLAQGCTWYVGTTLIGLPAIILTALLVGLKLFTVVVGVWTAARLVNLLAQYLTRRAERTETTFDDLLVPLISKSLKFIAVCVGLVVLADMWDMRPIGLLGGLGIGGLALGLAAKDTIGNFFGSLMLFSDRPFEKGDRIVVDGHDGPVESIGFRSTRIRTLEGHLVTVPNGQLANMTILNIGKRPHIRGMFDISITYDTPPEKVDRAVEIVRELLQDHEGFDPEFPPRVHFNRFANASLNIWVIYWYHPPDWWMFCDFNERLNKSILRRFNDENIEFAFPTQTLYLAGDPNRPLPALRAG